MSRGFLSVLSVLIGVVLWAVRNRFHDLDIYIGSLFGVKWFLVCYGPLILLSALFYYLADKVDLFRRRKGVALAAFSIGAWLFIELYTPTF